METAAGATPAFTKSANRSANETADENVPASSLANRRIWLPRVIYSALPYFYILTGILALFATCFVTEWFWIVPHYLIFSVLCIHGGIYVLRLRKRRRAVA